MATDVLLSGAVLSSMLFENINHVGVGEGFLLGEVDKITTQNITDTQMCLENSHYMTSISSYLPCSSLQAFYTGSGQLKVSNLKEILGNNFSKVIGWYRCRGRCTTTFKRELLIHEQLSKLMNRDDFVLVLFSAPSGSMDGTLNTLYKFYVMQNREMVAATFKIANMSETSSATYYKDSPNTHLYASHALEKSLKCIDNLEPGVKDIQELYSRLLSQLKELLPDYSASCEKQSKCVEELMKVKSQCHASGLTPNYVPKSSQEQNNCPLELIKNRDGREDTTISDDAPLINTTTQTILNSTGKKSCNKSPKKTGDLKLTKSGSITSNTISLANGAVTKKPKPISKLIRSSASISPLRNSRKAVNATKISSPNQSKKGDASLVTTIKPRSKSRTPCNSPAKCHKSISTSPEF